MRILTEQEATIKRLLVGDPCALTPNKLGDWSLLSISDRPEEAVVDLDKHMAKLQQYGCSDVLCLFFEDIESSYGDDAHIFTEEHGIQVLKFLDRNASDDTIVVQCHAGISRSGAIGVFASRYFKLDEDTFKKDNPYIYPNDLVYGVLLKLSGLTGQYPRWWESRINKNSIW